ncbi:MAG: COX15/CtaA family protein [Verrucomicrobium sp.]|nr:COX15/CtaA family protein [Verrucomicrobium sp.]
MSTTLSEPAAASAPYTPPPGLRIYSGFVVGAVLFLITVGALVTSHEAGMTVPDWPTSFHQNMFTFPYQKWVGGIFYEHSHRLVASGVGLLTVVLAIWMGVRESRRWLRNLGFVALGLVILQGVVGGLRVVWRLNDFGIPHAVLGQLFLVVTGLIALAYTGSWLTPPPHAERLPRRWQRGIHLVAGLIFIQLILGAVMRHQHAGLSIPDFPTAYHHFWPHVNKANLPEINAARAAAGQAPTTIMQIHLQMTHRMLAYIIFFGVVFCGLAVLRCRQSPDVLRNLAVFWLFLIFMQIALGAAVIWSGKSPLVATLHVVTGAALLLTGSTMAALVSRWRRSAVAVEA